MTTFVVVEYGYIERTEAMHDKINGPLYDDGEAGIHYPEQINDDEFARQYRIGKKLVVFLIFVMVISLGFSLFSAIGTRALVHVQNTEKKLEGGDIEILRKCLPYCHFEDIYSMKSVVVPFIAAEKIMLIHSLNKNMAKDFLLWEGDDMHLKIYSLIQESHHGQGDLLSKQSPYQKNVIYMVSHLFNRSGQNAEDRIVAINEYCDQRFVSGVCRKKFNPAIQSLTKMISYSGQINNEALSFTKKHVGE